MSNARIISNKEFLNTPVNERSRFYEVIENNVISCAETYLELVYSMKREPEKYPKHLHNAAAISDEYGIKPDAVRTLLNKRKTDHLRARLVPIIQDTMSKTCQELFFLEMTPFELPEYEKAYIAAYKRLSKAHKAEIDAEIAERKASAATEDSCVHYLKHSDSFTTAPDAVGRIARKRIREHCADNNIPEIDFLPTAHDSYFKCFRQFVLDRSETIDLNILICVKLHTDKPLDYFLCADYSGYPDLRINGKHIGITERRVLSDFLITGADQKLWLKAVMRAAMS